MRGGERVMLEAEHDRFPCWCQELHAKLRKFAGGGGRAASALQLGPIPGCGRFCGAGRGAATCPGWECGDNP